MLSLHRGRKWAYEIIVLSVSSHLDVLTNRPNFTKLGTDVMLLELTATSYIVNSLQQQHGGCTTFDVSAILALLDFSF
jgi:hypothetical protein